MWKLTARTSVAQRTNQRRYFKKYTEINGNTIYQNLWDAVKQCNKKQGNSKKKKKERKKVTLRKKKDYKSQLYNITVHFKRLNEAHS